MRNLFALLVAINHYHQAEINDLKGCLNDLDAMYHNLEWFCAANQEFHLHKQLLADQQATRQALIDGFQFYNDAEDGDICLFYFSGHGGQIDRPPEFWNEADEMLEALVCHADQGNDNLLIDKELSYLIAEAQRAKDVHFLVITDCCHSGSNTKGDSFCVRSVLPNLNSRNVDDYWGRSAYEEIRESEGNALQLSVPIGRHVKLAACASSELAKEKQFGEDGQTRGVFTYALLQVLKETGYNLSYLNLIRKASIKTELLATNQSPQLELVGLSSAHGNVLFLDGSLQEQRPAFNVSYEEIVYNGNATHQWLLNVGHFYGLKAHDIAVLNDGRTAEIQQVFATYSVLDPQCFTPGDKPKILTATVKPATRTILNLGCSPDSNAAVIEKIRAVCGTDRFPFVESDPKKGIDYVVHAINGEIALTYPDERVPIFKRISGHDDNAVDCFLAIVHEIAEWYHILSVNNPVSTIRENEIEIKLERVKNPHTYGNPDSAPVVPIDDWHSENVFRYNFDEDHPGGPWHTPAFKLSITNRSQRRKLWMSALYCGGGYDNSAKPPYPSTLFSIQNRFLAEEEVAVGGTASMIDTPNTPTGGQIIPYRSIMLSILDDYFDQGYNELHDTIKLFVSTTKIDTTPFVGNGMPIDVDGTLPIKFSRPGSEVLSKYDWCTFEIPITIVRPRDLGLITIKQDKSIYGLKIIGHPTFTAHVILSTCKEMIRATAQLRNGRTSVMAHPEILFGNEYASLLTFTTGLGAVEGMSVIEFYRAEGTDYISEEEPLLIQLTAEQRAQWGSSARIVLMTYSAETRTYQPLAEMDKNGHMLLATWPNESPSPIEGLGNSVKLFLMNVKPDYALP